MRRDIAVSPLFLLRSCRSVDAQKVNSVPVHGCCALYAAIRSLSGVKSHLSHSAFLIASCSLAMARCKSPMLACAAARISCAVGSSLTPLNTSSIRLMARLGSPPSRRRRRREQRRQIKLPVVAAAGRGLFEPQLRLPEALLVRVALQCIHGQRDFSIRLALTAQHVATSRVPCSPRSRTPSLSTD